MSVPRYPPQELQKISLDNVAPGRVWGELDDTNVPPAQPSAPLLDDNIQVGQGHVDFSHMTGSNSYQEYHQLSSPLIYPGQPYQPNEAIVPLLPAEGDIDEGHATPIEGNYQTIQTSAPKSLFGGLFVIAGWPGIGLYYHYVMAEYSYDYPMAVGAISCFLTALLVLIYILVKKDFTRRVIFNTGIFCGALIAGFITLLWYREDQKLCDLTQNLCSMLFLVSLVFLFVVSLVWKRERGLIADIICQLIGLAGMGLALWNKQQGFRLKDFEQWQTVICGLGLSFIFVAYILLLRRGTTGAGPSKALFAQSFAATVGLVGLSIFLNGSSPWTALNHFQLIWRVFLLSVLVAIWFTCIVMTNAYSDAIITGNLVVLSLFLGSTTILQQYIINHPSNWLQITTIASVILLGVFLLYSIIRILLVSKTRVPQPFRYSRVVNVEEGGHVNPF